PDPTPTPRGGPTQPSLPTRASTDSSARTGCPPPTPLTAAPAETPARCVSPLSAVQARAVEDPGGFWGAVADDLGLAWQRRPTSVLDVSRGVPFARWWTGGAFNYTAAALAPPAAHRPHDE